MVTHVIPDGNLDRAMTCGYYQVTGSCDASCFPGGVAFFGVLEVVCVQGEVMTYCMQTLTNIVTGTRYMRRSFGDSAWLSWDTIGVAGGLKIQTGFVDVDNICVLGKLQPETKVVFADTNMFDNDSRITVVISLADQLPLYKVDASVMQQTKSGFTLFVQNRETFNIPVTMRWNWVAVQ